MVIDGVHLSIPAYPKPVLNGCFPGMALVNIPIQTVFPRGMEVPEDEFGNRKHSARIDQRRAVIDRMVRVSECRSARIVGISRYDLPKRNDIVI